MLFIWKIYPLSNLQNCLWCTPKWFDKIVHFEWHGRGSCVAKRFQYRYWNETIWWHQFWIHEQQNQPFLMGIGMSAVGAKNFSPLCFVTPHYYWAKHHSPLHFETHHYFFRWHHYTNYHSQNNSLNDVIHLKNLSSFQFAELFMMYTEMVW